MEDATRTRRRRRTEVGRRRRADVVEPVLPLLPERVVITDYKSSDVRDPARARERAKESLQLTIYAMAWQAQTGRLPDAVALHFLESGLVGTAEVDARAGRDGRRRHPRGGRGDPGAPVRGHAVVHGLLLVRLPRGLPGERRPMSGR